MIIFKKIYIKIYSLRLIDKYLYVNLKQFFQVYITNVKYFSLTSKNLNYLIILIFKAKLFTIIEIIFYSVIFFFFQFMSDDFDLIENKIQLLFF